MTEPTLSVTDTIEPAARGVINLGLHEFNVAQSGVDDRRELGVLVRDAATQQVVGGLTGRTSLGVLFIDVFFLPEHLRGSGLGSRVLKLAEDEARARGCTVAVLITISFQAPGFYERNGYEAFGTIPCAPPETKRFFMKKELR